jgi:hypothetical protein
MTTTALTYVVLREVARQLSDHGWRPIPLDQHTKIPSEAGWQLRNTQPWSSSDLDAVVMRYPEHAAGLCVSADLCAVDIDVTDATVAGKVVSLATAILGDTPLVRVGNPPKALMVYRSTGNIRSTKRHPLEIFSGTGQFAAFGIHAKTGRPYDWVTGASPMTLTSTSPEIPVIDNSHVQRFLAEALPVLSTLPTPPTNPHAVAGGTNPASANIREMMRRGINFPECVRMSLTGVTAGNRHDTLVGIVAMGFSHGWQADHIETLIRRHAPASIRDVLDTRNDLERILTDLRPRHTTTF